MSTPGGGAHPIRSPSQNDSNTPLPFQRSSDVDRYNNELRGASVARQLNSGGNRTTARQDSVNTTSSSPVSRAAGPQFGETWMDFLRSRTSNYGTPNIGAGGSSSSGNSSRLVFSRSSSERKRRLTTGTEGQENGRRKSSGPGIPSTVGGPSHAKFAGAIEEEYFGTNPIEPTRDGSNVIDLTGSSPVATPAAQPMASERQSSARRQPELMVVLPIWQPDLEVSRCPICETAFSFWYRKHHCRYVT